MVDAVIEILNGICGAQEGELDGDMELFESGLLDSFGVAELIIALEDRFGVALDIASLTREEMATPALIAKRVEQERAG